MTRAASTPSPDHWDEFSSGSRRGFVRTERSFVPSVVQERRGERAGQESGGGEGKGGGGGRRRRDHQRTAGDVQDGRLGRHRGEDEEARSFGAGAALVAGRRSRERRAGAVQVAANRRPPRRRRRAEFAGFAEQEQRADGPEAHRVEAQAGPEPSLAVAHELGGWVVAVVTAGRVGRRIGHSCRAGDTAGGSESRGGRSTQLALQVRPERHGRGRGRGRRSRRRVQVWDFLEHDEQVAEQGTVSGEGELSGAGRRGRVRLEPTRGRAGRSRRGGKTPTESADAAR